MIPISNSWDRLDASTGVLRYPKRVARLCCSRLYHVIVDMSVVTLYLLVILIVERF